MIDPMNLDLRAIFAGWYGPEIRDPVVLPVVAAWLPGPLREWYGLAGTRDRRFRDARQVIAPSDIVVRDGKATFMKDPHAGFVWAFDAVEQDHVYEIDNPSTWRSVPETLSEFLVHHSLDELVRSPEAWRMRASGVDESLMPKLTATTTEVAFGGWTWPYPGFRIFMSDCVVANIGPSLDDYATLRMRPGFVNVSFAARRREDLKFLDELHDVQWFRQRPEGFN